MKKADLKVGQDYALTFDLGVYGDTERRRVRITEARPGGFYAVDFLTANGQPAEVGKHRRRPWPSRHFIMPWDAWVKGEPERRQAAAEKKRREQEQKETERRNRERMNRVLALFGAHRIDAYASYARDSVTVGLDGAERFADLLDAAAVPAEVTP